MNELCGANYYRPIGELTEESAEGTNPERLADLAGRALTLAEFAPDFELEPRLLTTLE